MKRSGSSRRFMQCAFAALIGFVAVIGSANTAAHANDDDDDDAAFDTKILRNILRNFGLRNNDGAGIDYRERSPLVLPSGTAELPPPERGNAAKMAGWPDDPDVKRAKQRKEAESKRRGHVDGEDDRQLLPSQYSSRAAARPGTSGGHNRSIEETSLPSTLKELGSKNVFSSLFAPSQETATFSGEPPRENLSEPPVGYRTPSPNQPYGVGARSWTAPKYDRQEPAR